MLTRNYFYSVVFIVVMLVYCLFFARMGYEEWDTGFISGLSWRIVNGEIMYEDFIYTKPPVTPYLNSLYISILPEEGQFYYIRCINYILFSVQVILTVLAINNIYNIKDKLKISLWGFITAAFIISYLDVSPYPWYTQDGLLFASIALYLKSKYKEPGLAQVFLIALFSFISALCKQSFYLIPFVFMAWIFVDFGLRKTLWFIASLAVSGGLFLLIITQMTSLPNFIAHITGQTHLYDLYFTNIYGYAHKHLKLYLVIAFIAVVLGINYRSLKNTRFSAIFKWFIVLQMATGIVYFIAGDAGIGAILAFNSCVFAVLYHYFILKNSIRYLFPLFVLLVIAWSASVSWGYPYPIFYLTGIMLTFLVLIKDIENLLTPAYYLPAGIILSLVAVSYNYTPYRDSNITQLKYRLDSISPKLKYIYTDKETFTRFAELKQLVDEYGSSPYMVTTNYSGAHYLFNTRNPASADWMINSEINYQLDRILNEAAAGKGYIFLEQDYDPVLEGGGPMHKSYSLFSQYVHKNLTPVKKSGYFTVYNAKELYEVLH